MRWQRRKVFKLSEKYLTKVSLGQKEEMKEKVLMNSLLVLLEESGTSFLFGMYQDLVVH